MGVQRGKRFSWAVALESFAIGVASFTKTLCVPIGLDCLRAVGKWKRGLAALPKWASVGSISISSPVKADLGGGGRGDERMKDAVRTGGRHGRIATPRGWDGRMGWYLEDSMYQIL